MLTIENEGPGHTLGDPMIEWAPKHSQNSYQILLLPTGLVKQIVTGAFLQFQPIRGHKTGHDLT